MATDDLALLGTFQKHIEDMRALVQCKVCLKPFYEPFTLSCGHTYCYSCLSSWLGGGHNRSRSKNCPDCRAEIRVEPCPNYTLRDLVHMFLNRAELIPEEESIEEHELGKAEEARVLAADRSGRGLFQGIFARPRVPFGNRPPHLPIAEHPIWDEEDHIERCPSCTHELEDGLCNHCGWEDHDFSDPDDSIGDVTEEMYDSDDLDSHGVPRSDIDLGPGVEHLTHLPFGFDYYDQQSEVSEGSEVVRRYVPGGYRGIHDYEDDEDEEIDEDNSEMDDFIERDEDHDRPEEQDLDSYGEETSTPIRHPYGDDSPGPYNVDSDGDSEDTAGRSPGTYDVNYHYDLSSEAPSDDLGYESGHVRYNPGRTAAYNIDYDSEPSGDIEHAQPAEDHTDYDSDSSVQEVAPISQSSAHLNRGRRRRVVLDDSEEEDDEVEEADHDTAHAAPPPFSSDDEDEVDNSEDNDMAQVNPPPFSSEDDDSGESDDTAIRGPPQNSNLRQRRLRQRRTNNSHRVARELSADGGSGYGSYGSRSPMHATGRRRNRPVVDLTQNSRPVMRVH